MCGERGTPSSSRELLAGVLKSGRIHMGELLLGEDFTLRHAGDAGAGEEGSLEIFRDPHDAREIARYDQDGKYRPLKTAPNLKRGWLLRTGSLEGMEVALDFFYPAALGLWLSWLRGTLNPTPLRETLHRQTGMYRVTQLITDAQAGELIGRCCSSEGGCLRTILWEMKRGEPMISLPASKLTLEALPADRIPLICRELCNLVVAAARPVARGNLPKTS